MYVHAVDHALGMSLVHSHAQFPGVTFRNVICHSNFRKYDDVTPWCEALMYMHIPSSTSGKTLCTCTCDDILKSDRD